MSKAINSKETASTHISQERGSFGDLSDLANVLLFVWVEP